MIDQLPRNSHYAESVADDEELARALAGLPERPPAPPRWSEYTPEYDALLTAIDRLGDVLATLIAVNSKDGKAPQIPRMPRPQNALHRIREQQRRARHGRLVAQVLPERVMRHRRLVQQLIPNDD